MASLSAVARALAELLSTKLELRATDYVPENPTPPAAFVQIPEVWDDTFDDQIAAKIELVVLVARGATPRVGQRSLYDLFPLIRDAIDANKSLGLDDTEVTYQRARGLSFEEVAAIGFYGNVYELMVTTPA